MINIERYELKTTKQGYQLVIHIDPALTEFSDELGHSPEKKEELSSFFKKQIKQKFPGLKILSVKVMIGSLLLSTMYLENDRTYAASQQTETTQQADVYVVKSGDSLSVIARDHGITVPILKEINNISSDMIFVGQTLLLPYTTYHVVSGDSLSVIGKKYGVSVEKIKNYNGLTSDIIRVGQQLKIPLDFSKATDENVPPEAIDEAEEPLPPKDTAGEPVDPGETEPPIDEAPEEAREETPPAKVTPEPITYTVVAGDSLSVIAKRYDTTVADIKSLNNLTSDRIFIDQTLLIPNTEEQPEAPEPEEPLPPTDTADEPVPVDPGETEPPIDNEPEEAREETPPTKVIPEPITYTVVAGDSLSVIAKRFGSTVDKIKSANGLTSDLIRVGQLLTIPLPPQETETPPAETEEPATPSEPEEIIVEAPHISYFEPINVANASEYELKGTAEANRTIVVTLTDENEKREVFELTPNDNGEFYKKIDVDALQLKDGDITLTAHSVHPEGAKSDEITSIIVKDTHIFQPILNSDFKYINAHMQNDVKIYGSAKENAVVSITITDENGKTVSAETDVLENGDFLVGIDVSTLADSTLQVKTKQTDSVGNVSDTTTFEVIKDTIIPEAPSLEKETYINNQNQNQFYLRGIAEKNAEVRISIFSDTKEKTVSFNTAESGEFRLPFDLSEFDDGELVFELSQEDKAGNQSDVLKTTVLKHTATPEVNFGEVAIIDVENVNDYTLEGTTTPNSELEITFSDGVQQITNTTTSDDEGGFLVNFDLSLLKDGELSLTIKALDRYGNQGKEKELLVEKDTIIPIELQFTSEKMINMHNQSSYLLQGESNKENGVVHVEITDGVQTIFEKIDVIDGKFAKKLDLSELLDGDIFVKIKQEGPNENISDNFQFSVEKHTEISAPTVSRSGYLVEGDRTLLNVVGTGEQNDLVHVIVLDENGKEVRTETVTIGEAGIFNIKIDVTHLGENLNYIVQTEDHAGNISEDVTVSALSHTVVPGDTLSQIAQRYNTTVQGIKAMNRMTGDAIFVDQVLKLPLVASTKVNLGYVYFGHPSGFTAQVLQTDHSLNVVSPSYFDINPDGTLKLTAQVDPNFVNNMHNAGIRVVPFLSNHWDRELGRAMISQPERAAQEIFDAIMKYNLDGINVDIENINHEDRENFTEFVRLLREKLPSSKEVSVAVAANPNNWTQGWHGAYDYRELGKHADYLMIMTYDESYFGGSEGPVASLPWVERSIQYAISQDVPSEKIVIGMAHFGRYWKEGQELGGYGISNTQIQEMLRKYEHEIVFDEVTQSVKATVIIKEGDPVMYRLGTPLEPGTYTVWYEDERSLKSKASLVQQYNLKGLGHWSIGQENPNIWAHYPTWTGAQTVNTVPIVEKTSPVTNDPVVEQENDMITYTVVSGDSLWRIANQFGVTINEIKETNNLTSDVIFVGQTLKINVQ